MSSITEVMFDNGWEVQARPVPPNATYVWQQLHIAIPDKPKRPMVSLVSEVTGHTEIVPALPDSDEWNEWLEQMKVWNAAVEDAHLSSRMDEMAYSLDYSIIAFRHQGLYPDSGWMKDAPDDWFVPDAFAKQCMSEDDVQDDRRMRFINLELLETSRCIDKISRIAFPQGDADTSPVREEEIRAVLEKFRTRNGVSNTTGSMDADTRIGERTHQDESVRPRDADRPRVGFIGRLVRALKRS